MNIHERLDYLVKNLTHDNAKVFAEKCSVPVASVSKWRHGARCPKRPALEKILAAFPEVRREWLEEGEGEPFIGEAVAPRSAGGVVFDKLDAIEKKIDEMLSIISRYR